MKRFGENLLTALLIVLGAYWYSGVHPLKMRVHYQIEQPVRLYWLTGAHDVWRDLPAAERDAAFRVPAKMFRTRDFGLGWGWNEKIRFEKVDLMFFNVRVLRVLPAQYPELNAPASRAELREQRFILPDGLRCLGWARWIFALGAGVLSLPLIWLLRRYVIRVNTVRYVLVTEFMLLLLAPSVFWNSASNEVRAERLPENRRLREMPRVYWHKFWYFLPAMDRYYQDRFPFRTRMVRFYDELMCELNGRKPPSWLCTVGRERNWYFIKQSEPEMTGQAKFSDADLALVGERLEYLRSGLARQGIDFLLVVCPDKGLIYPEYLPLRLRSQLASRRRLHQLTDYLAQHAPKLKMLYLGPAEMAAKKRCPEYLVYRPHDTHWTDYGAYEGVREVAKAIDPAAQLPPGDDLTWYRERASHGDILGGHPSEDAIFIPVPDLGSRMNLRRLRSPSRWTPSNPLRRYVNPEAKSAKSVFLVHDSFVDVAPTVWENAFRKTCFSKDYTPDLKAILQERPDVVVYEILERQLQLLTPSLKAMRSFPPVSPKSSVPLAAPPERGAVVR